MLMNNKYNKLFNIIIVVCISIFITLLILYNTNNISSFDNYIYGLISKYQCNLLTHAAKFFSFLCCTSFVLILCIIITIFVKNKKIGFYTTLCSILSYIINTIFKHIVMRPRPVGINLINEKSYSFPSGHSMGSVALYGLFIYIIYKSNINMKLKILLCSLLSLLILCIGLSRIYLGVHYASDVLAGYCLSLALLILFLRIINIKKD